MIFYTADTHFHYAPVLAERPFASVEEMDRVLVENWNETVAPEDTVYFVGDIGYNEGHVPCRVLAKLNGHKHLIRGNHDTGFLDAPLLYRYFETVTDFDEIEDGDTHVLLCHYPLLYDKKGYMIHGHLHRKGGPLRELLRGLPRVLNAGVDINGWRPVTLEELIQTGHRYGSEPADQTKRGPRGTDGWLPAKPDFRPIPPKPQPHRRHLFLTGEKQAGKSTVLRRLLQGRDAAIGGFLTLRIRTENGGQVHMLRAGREDECTPENLLFTRTNGVLNLEPGRFARVGCPILGERAGCDLLVMDELGPAEAGETAFQEAVLRCLEEETPVYGVLQQGESAFLQALGSHPQVQVVTVTEENRETLPQLLLEQGW